MSDSVREELEFAVDTARAAGRITLRYFQTGVDVDTKADHSPVTIADREAELEIRTRLQRAFPDDGFVGEEFGASAGTSGRTWFIDPIDGTKSFVAGVPLYGVLLGLQDAAGTSLVGVVYLPALDDMVFAGRGLVERSPGACFLGERHGRGDPVLHLFHQLRTPRSSAGLASPFGFGQTGPRVGGLLWPCPGGHGPGRGNAGPDHESVGLWPLSGHPRGSGGHLHRLAGKDDDSRR